MSAVLSAASVAACTTLCCLSVIRSLCPAGSSLVNKLSDDVFTKMTSKFSARREL